MPIEIGELTVENPPAAAPEQTAPPAPEPHRASDPAIAFARARRMHEQREDRRRAD